MGLLRKKKRDESRDPAAGKKSGDESNTATPQKRSLLKKLMILLLVVGILGGGGFFAYTTFFSGSGTEAGLVYQSVPLAHVTLPDEMLAFCFTRMPKLYDALVAFNGEMDLFKAEIARIDAVAAKYPDQKKIADGQKKVWDKGMQSLQKSFKKLEKPIKETFVLFQVNPAQGQEKIDQTAEQMTKAASDALEKSQELTAPLKQAMPKVPEGIIKGTLYKLKKKFL